MYTEYAEKITEKALALGFSAAAFMDAKELVIVPEYRKYCEMNLCGCYGVNPNCPPESGTVAEMTAKVLEYSKVLVLQTEVETSSLADPMKGKEAKIAHNSMCDELIGVIQAELGLDPKEMLRMSCGPWKESSCMSAYCVDAQKMADKVGMVCWAQDGKSRFFSQILFK